MNERTQFPIQVLPRYTKAGQAHVSAPVYMAAYEVYSHVYGPQKAMIEGGCRGGFGLGEIIGFLYARGFPKAEWRERVDEAFANMDLGA